MSDGPAASRSCTCVAVDMIHIQKPHEYNIIRPYPA